MESLHRFLTSAPFSVPFFGDRNATTMGGFSKSCHRLLCIFSLLQWTDRYTYSLVFAADMYSTVSKSDPLDPARGDRYRRSILKSGGGREELDSLEVKDVIPSNDTETELSLGIPWMRPKSGIYGGNIREFINKECS